MTPARRSPSALMTMAPLVLVALLILGVTLPHVNGECSFNFNDCMELYQLEINNSDIYIVGSDTVFNRVYCYNNATASEGGGWTGVLWQNQTGLETSWDTATDATGSGSLYGNFWIGTTALAQMTDVNMTLVIRANDTQGNWKVGLFELFRIEGVTLSLSMTYKDGNIGLEKSVYDGVRMTGPCLGYWWLPECEPVQTTDDAAGTSTTAPLSSVEMSIRPTVNDSQLACPPLHPFPADAASSLNMTVRYSRYWRGPGGTVEVACSNPGEILLWNTQQANLLMSGEDASTVPNSQIFTCKLASGTHAWEPSVTEALDGGPRCIVPCDAGYGSNLESGDRQACLKFVAIQEATSLQKAWEVCLREGASLANPFLTNSTLQTFRQVAAQQSVFTSVDRRNGIVAAGLVNDTLIPTSATGTNDCLFFAGGEFVSQPCFPIEPVATTGVVCQKPRRCPPNFVLHDVWGCYATIVVTKDTAPMTPEDASRQCATELGAALPPATGGEGLTMPYISTVNRRADNVTWRDSDGTTVQEIQLATDDDVTKQCLLVSPTTSVGETAAVACDAALEITAIGPSVLCVYPRRTDCYSNPVLPAGTTAPQSLALNTTVDASCTAGLMFNVTKQSAAVVTCHGALGNWLPAKLGECVTKCGSPPAAPANSVRTPVEASNQTSYTYTCAAGLLTPDGAPESTIACQDTGLYEPLLPANCTQCAGFPSLDETLVLAETPTGGSQGQTVTVTCSANMTTAEGQTSQTVTCGPTGWTPAVLSPCNVCVNLPSVDNTSVTVQMPPASTLGNVIIYSCPAGKAFETGNRITSAVCMPDGWFSCHTFHNCSMCVAEPPAPLANMNRTWSASNQTANYTCIAPLSLDGENATQTLGCELQGWESSLLPCDKCPEPSANVTGYTVTWEGVLLDNSTLTMTCPAGKLHSNLTDVQVFPCTADGWQADSPLPCDRCVAPVASPESNAVPVSTEPGVQEGSTVTFNCTDGLATEEGRTTFTETCQPAGWSVTTNCSHCQGDPPAQNLSASRDWSGDRAIGAVANYTCTSGVQALVTCGAAGWDSAADPCDTMPMHCSDPPVDTYNGTAPEDTGKGTEPNRTATYRCLNGVTTVLRCLEDGTWSTDQTPCAAAVSE
ncbi:uncharacterized protein LOC122384295 [Amphibalanus amphitrite]|uniref:uncharacterized protein LOC122384295 n=1 Tax=Amphibalanus amphitrite TaxID=1232801 RepID=UPI001C92A151|nr:uncharacterized protein LOC122384295 [Amphibalanus amphitrite]